MLVTLLLFLLHPFLSILFYLSSILGMIACANTTPRFATVPTLWIGDSCSQLVPLWDVPLAGSAKSMVVIDRFISEP